MLLQILDSAIDATVVVDEQQRILFVNAAAERVFDCPAPDALGQPIDRFLAEPSRPTYLRRIHRMEESGENAQRPARAGLTILRANGQELPVEASLSQYRAGQRKLFGITLRDITDRTIIDQRIRRSEQRNGNILNSLPAHIAVLDHQARITAVNAAWLRFARENGNPPGRRVAVGANYLQICRNAASAHAPLAREALEGIEAVLAGTLEQFVLEYPCHSPDQQRWFLMHVVPTVSNTAERGAVITHLDITGRKLAEDAIKEARGAAERANQAKDAFLATLSHELRTPLTPVLAATSMLEHDVSLSPTVHEHLEMIRRNVQMEARLIDDLLDLTRIVRGKIELDLRPVALSEVLHLAAGVCMPDIEARHLQFKMIDNCNGVHLNADSSRIQQVFWNVLQNAVKFTPPGGHIGVHARCAQGQAVVEILDTGVGIEPDALPRIFDAFEQSGRTVTRQFGGLGLGLAISRRLVELHGGAITAHSEGRGRGSLFRIVLPAAEAPAGQPAGLPQQAAQATPPLSILLVEDHADTARMLRQILSAEGHQVQLAADVATALDLATTHAYDLLISDLGLPDRSGLELMQDLRARGIPLPGIALSGYGHEEDVRRSHDAGFATHMVKPVDVDRLLRAIAQVAGK